MNYQDRVVGGGLPSLLGHGDVSQPGAFEFAQKSEPVLRYAEGGWAGESEYTDFLDQPQDQFLQNYAPTAQAAPAAVQPIPAQPQPQGQGYWTQGGMQGEDRIEPQWISTEPQQAVQPPAYDPTDYALSSFNWAKHGWTGGDPGVYKTTEGGGESGNVTTSELLGSTPEFANWLKSQGMQVVNQSRGPNADYALVKDGQVVDRYHHEPAAIDKYAPALMSAALMYFGVPPSVASGLTTYASSEGDLGAMAKAAGTAYLGQQAAPYISEAVQGTGLTGTAADITKGALTGAARGGIGAALGGGNVEDALISGAVSGGVSGGITSGLGQTDLPPEVQKVLAPTLTSAALGKDWKSTLVNAAGNQGLGALGKELSALTTPGAKDIAEADEAYAEEEPSLPEITQQDIEALYKPDVESALAGVAQPVIGEEETPQDIQTLLDAFDTTGKTGQDVDVSTPTGYYGSGEPIEYSTDSGAMTDREAEDRQGVSDVYQGLEDIFGGMTDREAEDRQGVSDVYQGIEDIVGGDMTDREAEDRRAVEDILAGTAPGSVGGGGGGGGKTTTGGGGTTATGSKSGMDVNSLLAMLALMGGSQQQATTAPQPQPFDIKNRLSVGDIFSNYFA